ncbi:glycosyltransferase family 4 protein [Enterovirga sp. CN4-39]|uniref:glycosyltransferase family 4 protein n=1 Tax=Enterovirga sp. CN4-39 TaxID=3400910 RepID=UPI003C0D0433
MTTDAVGGVWTYALDLAAGLRERDIEITLAILGPAPSDGQRQAAAGIAGLRIIETGLPLDWTAGSRDEVVGAGAALAALAAETGCELVQLNSPALAADAAFPCPVISVCHSCVATWWAAVRGGSLPEDFAWRTDLVRSGYQAADLLLAPSAAFARATATAYALGELPRVVHNGRAARPDPSPREPVGRCVVLTAGRLWDEGKNIAALDRVAQKLPAPMLAAGPTHGPNGAAITLHHAAELGYVDAATLDGHFARQPVFASLALYEPFGLAVLEAAQAGCPLVLSDIPTFRELWDEAALFVHPEDENGAVAILTGLLADATERDRLGRAAQERAGRYRLDRMVEGVAGAYRDVLASKGRRPHLMTAA